ncbi:unnamed protein product [Toxocara canis]|uniref:Reverse transcriptase domain-containing protein n=1 Tax=Toxocara canis TaxID=6265 RepID=A0A183UDU1_TOXCA|nr:unnamed protein product [Toxocara canis]
MPHQPFFCWLFLKCLVKRVLGVLVEASVWMLGKNCAGSVRGAGSRENMLVGIKSKVTRVQADLYDGKVEFYGVNTANGDDVVAPMCFRSLMGARFNTAVLMALDILQFSLNVSSDFDDPNGHFRILKALLNKTVGIKK